MNLKKKSSKFLKRIVKRHRKILPAFYILIDRAMKGQTESLSFCLKIKDDGKEK